MIFTDPLAPFIRTLDDPYATDPSVPNSMTIAANCVNYCDSQPCRISEESNALRP